MARLDRWKIPGFIDMPFATIDDEFSAEDNAALNYIFEVQQRFYEKYEGERLRWDSQSGIIRASRELIYNVCDGKPILHVIGYSFNIRRGELQIGHDIDILIEGNTPEEISEEIRNVLAVAYVHEVPVYPNNDELTEELAEHFHRLMVDGFTAPDEKGGRVRLKLTKAPGLKIDSIDYLNEVNINEPRHPAELALIRATVSKELGKLSEAKRLVSSLELAIDELSKLLTARRRNEKKLQKCLTENPVLLGLEYRKVIPEHKLGAEYKMDYALQRFSGLVDLMELEASNLPLFNKKGDPSQYLIHAEQQALDWLLWIERNHPYAREGLPGIIRPLCFVLIGRSKDMEEAERRKLLLRNTMFRGDIQIFTYDDVLKRGQTMHSILTGGRNNL